MKRSASDDLAELEPCSKKTRNLAVKIAPVEYGAECYVVANSPFKRMHCPRLDEYGHPLAITQFEIQKDNVTLTNIGNNSLYCYYISLLLYFIVVCFQFINA